MIDNKKLFTLSNLYATDFDFIAQDIIKRRELYEILGWENELCLTQIVIGYLVQDYDGNHIKEFQVNQESEAIKFLFPPLTREQKKFEKKYWKNFKQSKSEYF